MTCWRGECRDACYYPETCTEGVAGDDGQVLPDALDSLPIATLLHSRLASWFGDDRQSFLVADLVPVVTQIVAEFQHNALEMARKADLAEHRAEEAEYHVEQLRDALEGAERRIERVEALVGGGDTRTLDDIDEAAVLIDDLRAALKDVEGEPLSCNAEGIPHSPHDWDFGSGETFRCAGTPGCETECSGLCGEHHWLDRPESDTRECLICGAEVAG